jgi:uncharacterized protein YndB with AHSA1/START domain
MAGFIATAEIDLDAPPERVWQALTDPALLKQYAFGADVESAWTPGSSITWSGEFQGRPYRDHGEIVAADPPHRLELTHFSPLTGQPDVPENYHRLVYLLEPRGTGTHLRLDQDNNADETAAEQSRANWQQVFEGLEQLLDRS